MLLIAVTDMFNPWQLYVGDQDNMQAEWYGREDFTLDTGSCEDTAIPHMNEPAAIVKHTSLVWAGSN